MWNEALSAGPPRRFAPATGGGTASHEGKIWVWGFGQGDAPPEKEGVFSGITAASENKGGHPFGLGASAKGAQPWGEVRLCSRAASRRNRGPARLPARRRGYAQWWGLGRGDVGWGFGQGDAPPEKEGVFSGLTAASGKMEGAPIWVWGFGQGCAADDGVRLCRGAEGVSQLRVSPAPHGWGGVEFHISG